MALYNNFASDTFFIKANLINSQQQKNDNLYGDKAIGVSYRFVVTDLDDNKFVIAGSQAYQSGYMSNQLPYAYLCVGRSNNYIETFWAGTSLDGQKAERMWTPIIPNSQLFIFAKGDDVSTWGLELFINPTDSLFLIVVSCAVCLFIIGMVIIFLHCKEKQEDRRKRD